MKEVTLKKQVLRKDTLLKDYFGCDTKDCLEVDKAKGENMWGDQWEAITVIQERDEDS